MNCSDAREKLMDLIYDELPPGPERAELEAHLASCPACRGELDRLRFARAAVAGAMAGEPAGGTGILPVGADGVETDSGAMLPSAEACPSPFPSRPPAVAGRHASEDGSMAPEFVPPAPRRSAAILPLGWRWVRRGAAAAAAAVVVFAIYMLTVRTPPPAAAESGPPEIRRQGVSLTILSQPEGWVAAPGDMQVAQQQKLASQSDEAVQAEQVPDCGGQMRQTWINAPANGDGTPIWRGMALVRDQRIVRRLPKGATEVAFTDVPSGILPDTVRLRSLDRLDGLTILEQDYQYDLASASAVLRKYVDKPVTVVFKKDDRPASGTLLSFDPGSLVIRPDGQGPRTITREELSGIAFAKLPAGLLTRPTLLWRLDNRAESQQQFEVAYLTHGLTWRADYVLKLHPAAGAAPKTQAAIEDVTDTADLVGYATVNNFSGVMYDQAQLKLMAGDVNLIKPPRALLTDLCARENRARPDPGASAPAMTEKSFFEYHLYTVTRPTTIRNAETKQIEMVSGGGLKLRRGYVYDLREGIAAPRVVSELMNSQANGLGKPLPKGTVRLYAPDPDGQETFVAATEIDHTPKDEKLRLPWGHAFDIACSVAETASQHRGAEHASTWEFRVRNHKDRGVNLTIMVNVRPTTYRAECKGFRWHVREVGVVEIDVPVAANAAATVIWIQRWNDNNGGGLKSPEEEKKAE